ncbi:MAG: hypothetical protein KDI55_26750 [Anaerolineae bacterium]|nr:hypothetical protein [Anaerolineae bacterium]
MLNHTKKDQLAFNALYIWPEKAWEAASRVGRHPAGRLIPLLVLGMLLTSCEEGGAIPPAMCAAYNNSLFTLRLLGGASLILGLVFLGFKKQISTILPSQGAQTGAVVSSIAAGVVLLALSTDIGTQVLTTFGLPDIAASCP